VCVVWLCLVLCVVQWFDLCLSGVDVNGCCVVFVVV